MNTKQIGDDKYELTKKNWEGFLNVYDWYCYVTTNLWSTSTIDKQSRTTHTKPKSKKEIDMINDWLRNEGTKYHEQGDRIDIRIGEGEKTWKKYQLEFHLISDFEIPPNYKKLFYNEKERMTMNFFSDLLRCLIDIPKYKNIWDEISKKKRTR